VSHSIENLKLDTPEESFHRMARLLGKHLTYSSLPPPVMDPEQTREIKRQREKITEQERVASRGIMANLYSQRRSAPTTTPPQRKRGVDCEEDGLSSKKTRKTCRTSSSTALFEQMPAIRGVVSNLQVPFQGKLLMGSTDYDRFFVLRCLPVAQRRPRLLSKTGDGKKVTTQTNIKASLTKEI